MASTTHVVPLNASYPPQALKVGVSPEGGTLVSVACAGPVEADFYDTTAPIMGSPLVSIGSAGGTIILNIPFSQGLFAVVRTPSSFEVTYTTGEADEVPEQQTETSD